MQSIILAGMPDSAIIREAAVLVRRMCNDKIFNHSLRTHYLAVQYATRFGIATDREQLALACLFHDTGLMPDRYTADRSFTFNSSRALREFLSERAHPPQKIRGAMEAIDWHFVILPRWDLGETAGLLQVGAWMDVTGLRSWSMFREYRRSRQLFENGGFFSYFNACVLRQVMSPKRAIGLLAPARSIPPGHYDSSATDRDPDRFDGE